MTTDSYPGTPIFIKALKLVASGSANTQKGAQSAISFLNSALNQGLSLPDQAIAYKTLGDKYIIIEDYNKSYISNKKALNIKKSLIISEEEEKFIWNHTYELIAATATHIAENDGIDGINLYKEVIELTDHPRAHLNIGVLYAKNNDIENAAYHWQYILDNEYKLGAFDSYFKNCESARKNLEISKDEIQQKCISEIVKKRLKNGDLVNSDNSVNSKIIACPELPALISPAPPVTIKCPQCGTDNPPQAKFCRRDGYRFSSEGIVSPKTKSCSSCGSDNILITLGKPPALPGDPTRFDLYGSRVCRAARRMLMGVADHDSCH